MSRGKRYAIFAGVAAVLAAGALVAYFSADSRAREKKAAKGPGAVPVAMVAAVKETVPVRLLAIGNVEPYASVAVKARVDGQILEVRFHEGQEVKKGDILFRIDPRPFEAALKQYEAQALRDVASRDQAASQERRYQELLDKNFVSKEAYAQYRTNAQTADATSRASQAALENARLNLDYTVIRSPIDGYVGRALLQAGNMVKANDTISLLIINQVKPVYVNFAIPEQQLTTVRELMRKGPLRVEAMASGTEKVLATGRVAFLDNAVDQATGTIKVRGIFDNADLALWPGQFCSIRVTLYDQENAIVVPVAAIQTGPTGEYVFVVKADSTAEVRKVTVSRSGTDQAIIGSGLAEGERVVTRGQLRVTPGAKLVARQEKQ